MRSLEEVLKRFGGQTGLADALGISRQAVYQWKEAAEIPLQRQYQLEVLTDGWFRAPRPDTAEPKRA